MTLPAGPEEVREPDFEAATTDARELDALDRASPGWWPRVGNLARAYVALQAQLIQSQNATREMHQRWLNAEASRREDAEGLRPWLEHGETCGMSYDTAETECICGLASRLAKLEQERGREGR